MPQMRNMNSVKKKLMDLKPGNTFRTVWDNIEGYYIVGKTGADPSIQTPMGKVLVFNIETGRAVFKPLTLEVEVIKIAIQWEHSK